MTARRLVVIDSVLCLCAGAALLLAPDRVISAVGLPPPEPHVYATMLGAILFSMGLALLTALRDGPSSLGGLGLRGAVVIKLAVSIALAGALLYGDIEAGGRGRVFLGSMSGLLALLTVAGFFAVKSSPDSA